jgi:translation initiation factor 2B subunit (eIF-2B alpha/beta/delta family)
MDYRSKFSELFLKIESDVGTTQLNYFVLTALKNAIHHFKEKDEQDFFEQFNLLLENVKNTEPRIALIIDSFYDVWKVLDEAKKVEHPAGHYYWEKKVIDLIKKNRKITKEESHTMTKFGVKTIKKGDVILIHSISHTVLDVIIQAKKSGRDFKIIVAEQEVEKTQQLIEILSKNTIHFQVVPEYMLSHIESDITKVFLGGVTINEQMNVVADAGSNAIVSEFHLHKTPIYLFISTRKFSLWKSRESHHTYKVKNIRTVANCKPITFERIKFSHDRVPLDFYDFIVTELGVMTPSETFKMYQEKFSERASWRKQFFQDA